MNRFFSPQSFTGFEFLFSILRVRTYYLFFKWAVFETVHGCQKFNSFSPYGGNRTGTVFRRVIFGRPRNCRRFRTPAARSIEWSTQFQRQRILRFWVKIHGRGCKKCSHNTSRYTEFKLHWLHVYLREEQHMRYGVVGFSNQPVVGSCTFHPHRLGAKWQKTRAETSREKTDTVDGSETTWYV